MIIFDDFLFFPASDIYSRLLVPIKRYFAETADDNADISAHKYSSEKLKSGNLHVYCRLGTSVIGNIHLSVDLVEYKMNVNTLYE